MESGMQTHWDKSRKDRESHLTEPRLPNHVHVDETGDAFDAWESKYQEVLSQHSAFIAENPEVYQWVSEILSLSTLSTIDCLFRVKLEKSQTYRDDDRAPAVGVDILFGDQKEGTLASARFGGSIIVFSKSQLIKEFFAKDNNYSKSRENVLRTMIHELYHKYINNFHFFKNEKAISINGFESMARVGKFYNEGAVEFLSTCFVVDNSEALGLGSEVKPDIHLSGYQNSVLLISRLIRYFAKANGVEFRQVSEAVERELFRGISEEYSSYQLLIDLLSSVNILYPNNPINVEEYKERILYAESDNDMGLIFDDLTKHLEPDSV